MKPVSVRYALPTSEPIVFDCRWNSPRRMGLGDKLVVCSALQKLAARGFSVLACCNSADKQIFALTGIPIVDEPSGFTVPWRGHLMEPPIGVTVQECEEADAAARHPVERALWSIGCEEFAGESPAWKMTGRTPNRRKVITWSPIEVSRSAWAVQDSTWISVLERALTVNPGAQVEAWCHMSESGQMILRLRGMPPALSRRISIKTSPMLYDYADAVRSAALHVTPNSGGLWVGMGCDTPMLVVQREPANVHQAMWQAKTGWRRPGMVLLTDSAAVAGARQRPNQTGG